MATVSELSASLSEMSASISRWTEMLQQINAILDRMNGVSSASSSSSTASATFTPTTTATTQAAPPTPAASSAASTTTSPNSFAPTPATTPSSARASAVVPMPHTPTIASTPPTTAVAISFRLPTPPFLAAKKKIAKTTRREQRVRTAVFGAAVPHGRHVPLPQPGGFTRKLAQHLSRPADRVRQYIDFAAGTTALVFVHDDEDLEHLALQFDRDVLVSVDIARGSDATARPSSSAMTSSTSPPLRPHRSSPRCMVGRSSPSPPAWRPRAASRAGSFRQSAVSMDTFRSSTATRNHRQTARTTAQSANVPCNPRNNVVYTTASVFAHDDEALEHLVLEFDRDVLVFVDNDEDLTYLTIASNRDAPVSVLEDTVQEHIAIELRVLLFPSAQLYTA